MISHMPPGLIMILAAFLLPFIPHVWRQIYMVGAVDSGYLVILGVLGLSSLLNIYYLLEPVSRGFFRPKVKTVEVAPHLLVVIPPVLTAILSLFLFFYVDFFAALAKLMVIS